MFCFFLLSFSQNHASIPLHYILTERKKEETNQLQRLPLPGGSCALRLLVVGVSCLFVLSYIRDKSVVRVYPLSPVYISYLNKGPISRLISCLYTRVLFSTVIYYIPIIKVYSRIWPISRVLSFPIITTVYHLSPLSTLSYLRLSICLSLYVYHLHLSYISCAFVSFFFPFPSRFHFITL